MDQRSSRGASETVRRLALRVASCPDVDAALLGNHPCSEVVRWQHEEFKKIGLPESEARDRMHRPEPWAGNLETAKIIWISSNPGFDIAENFPTWGPGWTDELDRHEQHTADFMANRFEEDPSRPFGAGDRPSDSWDRTVGRDRALSKNRVKTWASIRKRSALILGEPIDSVRASRDYAMTEVVHCKSKREGDLLKPECVSHCSAKWLSQILDAAHCPAGLVIVSGRPAAYEIRSVFPEIGPAWGPPIRRSDDVGYWPKNSEELDQRFKNGTWTIKEQSRHTVQVENFFGKRRTVVWLPHSTAQSTPRRIDDPKLIDPKLIEIWRNAANS